MCIPFVSFYNKLQPRCTFVYTRSSVSWYSICIPFVSNYNKFSVSKIPTPFISQRMRIFTGGRNCSIHLFMPSFRLYHNLPLANLSSGVPSSEIFNWISGNLTLPKYFTFPAGALERQFLSPQLLFASISVKWRLFKFYFCMPAVLSPLLIWVIDWQLLGSYKLGRVFVCALKLQVVIRSFIWRVTRWKYGTPVSRIDNPNVIKSRVTYRVLYRPV